MKDQISSPLQSHSMAVFIILLSCCILSPFRAQMMLSSPISSVELL